MNSALLHFMALPDGSRGWVLLAIYGVAERSTGYKIHRAEIVDVLPQDGDLGAAMLNYTKGKQR